MSAELTTREKVQALLGEGHHKRAIAAMLGISRQGVTYLSRGQAAIEAGRRRATKRRRAAGQHELTCRVCGELGHNAASHGAGAVKTLTRYWKRDRYGLCSCCGTRRPRHGKRTCVACARRRRERWAIEHVTATCPFALRSLAARISRLPDNARHTSGVYQRLLRRAGLLVSNVNEPPPGWTVDEDRREELIALTEIALNRRFS